MMILRGLLFILALLAQTSPVAAEVAAPIAKTVPHRHETHGDVREDPYFWLRERDTPEVLAHLKAENDYYESVMAPTLASQKKLYSELRGRIKEADVSAPVKDGPYEYYRRTREGEDYPVFCRRKTGTAEAPEEILLDVNILAKEQTYFSVPRTLPSPDHKWIAYPVDVKGRRFYTWHFKNLESGKTADDRITDVTANLVWSSDNKTVYYTAQNPQTLRWDKVYRRVLGRPEAELIFFEEDETFSVTLYPSLTEQWIFLAVDSTLSEETRYFPSDPDRYELKTFLPREKDHEYSVVDGGDRFYILTNWKARNFRVMEVSPDKTRDKSAWREVVPHRTDTLIEGLVALKTHLALGERSQAMTQIRVLKREKHGASGAHVLEFNDPAYMAGLGEMREYDSTMVRYDYDSLTTPPSVYDYEIASKKHILRKQKEVLGGFLSSRYQAQRLMVSARDGARVPVSLVYRKDQFKKGENPGLVYGYGSYGLSMDPEFDSNVVSLLDRGLVYAIAHIRGGSEMGRSWYENGRQDKKLNTFRDFIDATEALIAQGWIKKGHAYAMGGSAGGLLMGAVTNMRPDLYRGILALVPFVDAVTTMLDSSIPLTTEEYDEWGNPNDPRFYKYIKSYSPYDNVAPLNYPAVYVETGYHDSQVQYWEPAKWVARLRALKTGSNPVLFRTEMAAGHSGRTGRFVKLEQVARNFAFILMQEKLD